MAAQESPIRINARLLAQAQAAAETFRRKTPEQIGYWADIGRILESRLSASDISAILSGIATVHVSLPAATQNSNSPGIRYKASTQYPGFHAGRWQRTGEFHLL